MAVKEMVKILKSFMNHCPESYRMQAEFIAQIHSYCTC